MLLERVRQVGVGLMDTELSLRAHIFSAEGCFLHHADFLPYSTMRVEGESARLLKEVGNRRAHVIMSVHEGKALLDLGQRDQARTVLEACLALAERVHDETPLGYAWAYMARLGASEDLEGWARAEQLANKVLGNQNLTMVAQARVVLAKIHWQRGDLSAAEAEARAVCELVRRFPCYRPEMVALWSRVLAAQGKTAESLQVCQEGVEQIESLGLEGSGLLDLYAALVDAHLRCGNEEAARAIVARALPILQRRVDDIPDPAMRTVYLRALPENARLSALAVKWSMGFPSYGQVPIT
jgi:tetratricopeptide (TPR) repeat protein